MKNTIITIFGICLLYNISCKDYSKSPNKEINQESLKIKQNDSIIYKENQEDIYIKYTKWDSINKTDEIYQNKNYKIELKSYLDEQKNIGGKKIYINNEEIDFIVSDAYVFTPYLFKYKKQQIILVQEEDEGGIYGYIMYYFNNDKFINKQYLDISPNDNDVSIDKFIEFKDKKSIINIKILTNQYYDTKLDRIKNSVNYSFSFQKK